MGSPLSLTLVSRNWPLDETVASRWRIRLVSLNLWKLKEVSVAEFARVRSTRKRARESKLEEAMIMHSCINHHSLLYLYNNNCTLSLYFMDSFFFYNII